MEFLESIQLGGGGLGRGGAGFLRGGKYRIVAACKEFGGTVIQDGPHSVAER